jgi:hypothetical protein
MGEVNERKRLRMNGRPMLEWIDKMVKCRMLLGGEVTWTHIKSHASGSSRTKDQVGNSCADLIAGFHRASPEQTLAKAMPLELGEFWLSIKDEKQMLVSNDVRSQVKVRIKEMCLSSWMESPSQGKFASASVLSLCKLVLSQDRDSPVLLRVVSNTFQYYWDAQDESEHVKQKICDGDHKEVELLDVAHVLTCADLADKRNSVALELVCLFEDMTGPSQWFSDFAQRNTQDDMLGSLMVELMLNGDSLCYTEADKHRVMFGGFSQEEGRVAMARLGVVDLDALGKSSMLDVMRLLLFEQFVS